MDSVAESDLELMVLETKDLPSSLSGYRTVRESVLGNESMAEKGFASASAERFAQAGRINGFVREFGPDPSTESPDKISVVVGTVAHLFKDPESVAGWMKNVFLKDFEESVGQAVDDAHELAMASRELCSSSGTGLERTGDSRVACGRRHVIFAMTYCDGFGWHLGSLDRQDERLHRKGPEIAEPRGIPLMNAQACVWTARFEGDHERTQPGVVRSGDRCHPQNAEANRQRNPVI